MPQNLVLAPWTMADPSFSYLVAYYVCPTIGAILSTLAFAAPIRTLRSSMMDGSLGNLNPTPWAFMTGDSD